jgi:hypothetical protein
MAAVDRDRVGVRRGGNFDQQLDRLPRVQLIYAVLSGAAGDTTERIMFSRSRADVYLPGPMAALATVFTVSGWP